MRRSFGSLLAAALFAALPADVQAQAPKWVVGPATVELGEVGHLKLPRGFRFADGRDSRRLLERMGNATDDTVLGLVSPEGEENDWIVVFQYLRTTAADPDKEKILATDQSETDEHERFRQQNGFPPSPHVVGWFADPHYDESTRNFEWALRYGHENGHEFVNYHIRLRGREGYMDANLVDEPASVPFSKPQVDKLLSGFDYVAGKGPSIRAADVAAELLSYGLAGMNGGAGAAALRATRQSPLARAAVAVACVVIVGGVIGAAIRVRRRGGRRGGHGG